MVDPFQFADDLGPAKIVHIHVPAAGLRAIVVIDNLACGPAIGGVRMAPDVTLQECFRLARAMTLKNAAAGLAHGGGKSVIMADPRMDRAAKERVMRAFAHAIRDLRDYIPGPDMGTDETCMAWVRDETGRAVGLPAELGGIPLDALGTTGFGVAIAVAAAAPTIGLDLQGARVAVQGFGAVGQHAARFLAEKGARLVAAADSGAMVADERGLNVAALIRHKQGGKALAAWPGAVLNPDSIIDVACDIWIPAARPDVLRADNVARLTARIVAQGANIPATGDAEAMLHRRGVLVLPDFIANAGGVISAAVEYRGGSAADAFAAIADKIGHNTREMLAMATRDGMTPRAAGFALAHARLAIAAATRRWR